MEFAIVGKTDDTLQDYQRINGVMKQYKWPFDIVRKDQNSILLVSGLQLSHASQPISGAG